MSTIQKQIDSFVAYIAEKYDLNTQELLKHWKENRTTSKEGGCPYVFRKGKNEGKTCNSKIRSGGLYCSRHKQYEGKELKTKPKIPKPKEIPSKKYLRKSKHGFFWHPETTFVFKSINEKVVIGKAEGKNVKDLTEEDISLCKLWGFAYEEKKGDANVKMGDFFSLTMDDNVEKETVEQVLDKIQEKKES